MVPRFYKCTNVTVAITYQSVGLLFHLQWLMFAALIAALIATMARGRGRGTANPPRRSRRTRTSNRLLHNDDMEVEDNVDVESGSCGEHPRPEQTSPGFYQMGTATATRRNNRERAARSRARRSQASQPFDLDDTADEEAAPVWRTEANGMPSPHDCGARSITCPHCGAKLWKKEKGQGMLCCRNGQTHAVLKDLFSKKPEPLWELFNFHELPATEEHNEIREMGKLLRVHARPINNQFSMASSTAYRNKVDGYSYLSLHGALYHYTGPPTTAGTPKFAQLYVVDEEYGALAARMAALNAEDHAKAPLYRRLLQTLQDFFNTENQLVRNYICASEIPAAEVAQYKIVFKATGTIDKRRYNPATTNEISGFMPGGENAEHGPMQRQAIPRRTSRQG